MFATGTLYDGRKVYLVEMGTEITREGHPEDTVVLERDDQVVLGPVGENCYMTEHMFAILVYRGSITNA